MEKWKEITGYEGYYSISNYGRIKSLSRNVGYNLKESILTINLSKVGYKTVDLYKNKKRKTFYVHRLVAFEFCDNKNGYDCINHIDENKLNNHFSNLEWWFVESWSGDRNYFGPIFLLTLVSKSGLGVEYDPAS